MQIYKYQRKAFEVEAVQVSEENIPDVAEWCDGEVIVDDKNPHRTHVKVKVKRPLNDKQTRAYFGDWVLLSESGYKVYTNRAFVNSFERIVSGDPFPTQAAGNIFENQPEEDKSQELRVVDEPVQATCDNCLEQGELFDVIVSGGEIQVCKVCKELLDESVNNGYSADASAQSSKPQPDAIARHEASNLMGGKNE